MQPGWKYSVLCTPAKRALNGHTSTRQTGVPKHLVLLLTCLQGTKHQARFANTFFVGCITVTNGSIFCALSTGRTGYRHSQTDAQASAVSCYQSLQSRSSRDKITWSHRDACMSEVWLPYTDFMVPSLCCAIQVPVATAALEERMLLPAHKGRCSLRGYRGRKLLVCHRKCAHRRTDQLYKLAWISALQAEAGPSHFGILEVGRWPEKSLGNLTIWWKIK